jgi:hypothetical protein
MWRNLGTRGIPTTSDKQESVDVLKGELELQENGGYRHPVRASWRPQFLFQDSPTCLNFDPKQRPKPCTDCALMQLTPADSQHNKFPGRHIALNEQGDTLDSLYRCGSFARRKPGVPGTF